MTCRGLRALFCTVNIGWLLAIAQPAAALTLTLAGPTSGPFSSGVGSQVSVPGAQLTFSVSLDAATAINGYDVTLAWDAAELGFFAASAAAGLPFSSAPDAEESAGSRVSAIRLSPLTTTLLFRVTFNVLAISSDGIADVSVFVDNATNGSGIAPGSLSLANPGGAGIDVVPEPARAALVALALAALGATRFAPSARERT